MKNSEVFSRRIIHFSFEIGVFLKGFDGLLEVLGAIILYFTSPQQISWMVTLLTQHELSEDSNDFIANHLQSAIGHISADTKAFAGFYLLIHGVLKVFLVWALFRSRLWAYPTAIVVFMVFGLYQMYRYTLSHSAAMFALIILDVFVILLTWAEYHELRKNQARRQRARIMKTGIGL